MGAEFAQETEWNAEVSLDWHLAAEPERAAIGQLLRDLNRQYRAIPALHELDAVAEGFAWIVYDDRQNGVVAFERFGTDRSRQVVAVCNFSGRRIDEYRIGVSREGWYRETLNTDAAVYGGRNEGNLGGVHTQAIGSHGRPQSLVLTIPALGALWLQPEGA
jgi:1,4-alpha-glucan branching enzyme